METCLSTDLIIDAIGLWNRIGIYSKYKRTHAVCQRAQLIDKSWSTYVTSKMKQRGVINAKQKYQSISLRSQSMQKMLLRRYQKEHVRPAMRRWENTTWWKAADQIRYIESRPEGEATVMQAARTASTIRAVQHWAQLKLQGFFSREDAKDDDNFAVQAGRFRLCNGCEVEDARHLLLECPGTQKIEHYAVQMMRSRGAEEKIGRGGGSLWIKRVFGSDGAEDLPIMVEMVDQMAMRCVAQAGPSGLGLGKMPGEMDGARKSTSSS